MKLHEWINKKLWQSIFTRLNVKNEYSLKIQRSPTGKLYLGLIYSKALNCYRRSYVTFI